MLLLVALLAVAAFAADNGWLLAAWLMAPPAAVAARLVRHGDL